MRKTLSENACWQRIEAVINHYQFRTVSAFARHLGLNRAENLYQIRQGNNRISPELAKTICSHFPDISLAWLITGEGAMLYDVTEPVSEKIVEIPFYFIVPDDPAELNPDKYLYCSKEIVGDAQIVTVYRDNALLPTYKSGAILFLKKWVSGHELLYGNVYFIRTAAFEVFRVVRKGDKRGTLRLTSYQPDKYDDMVVPIKEIITLYYVCGANIF